VTAVELAAPQGFRLDGHRAVVTGAGRGIGRACALALAAAGADVVALSRTASEIDAVASEIKAAGGYAEALRCDVTDAAEVAERLGGLEAVDVLVTSAGTNIPEPFLDVSPAHLDALLAVNVRGTFLAAQAAARRMVESGGGGAIVTVSSQMGHVGAAGRTAYCATKHAVEGLTKAMAVELAPHGIRVNAVAPTFVETPLTRRFLADAEFRADVMRRIPLGRTGRPEDVASAVVYLASPAARMVTGASLLVDGGWTAQ
jgi:NAD(P)-dependent dehydrogenase (short-subunit alcohol dehydrogenase family)